jgi:hypothetical protein
MRVQHFYVNADAIRVLDWDSDGVAGTDDDTLSDESLEGKSTKDDAFVDVPLKGPRFCCASAEPLCPLTGVHPSANLVVESSDADELEELGMATDAVGMPSKGTLTM